MIIIVHCVLNRAYNSSAKFTSSIINLVIIHQLNYLIIIYVHCSLNWAYGFWVEMAFPLSPFKCFPQKLNSNDIQTQKHKPFNLQNLCQEKEKSVQIYLIH